jgi:molybdopterin molybdotransferase
LAALATRAGAMAARVGPIPADSRSIRNALEDQLIRADLILVSGGSEPGEPGVRQYLLQQGEVAYDDTSTNLGSYGHGVLGEDRVPVLALPSDPVRAAMLFSVLAVPMLRTLRGLGPTGSDVFSLAQDVPRHPTATSLLLAKVDRHGWAFPLSGTPNTLDLSRSDAVIRILPGAGVMPRGARVPAERVGGDPRNG